MLAGPAFDIGATPDMAGREAGYRLGEVEPLAIADGSALRDADHLRDLGQADDFVRTHAERG